MQELCSRIIFNDGSNVDYKRFSPITTLTPCNSKTPSEDQQKLHTTDYINLGGFV